MNLLRSTSHDFFPNAPRSCILQTCRVVNHTRRVPHGSPQQPLGHLQSLGTGPRVQGRASARPWRQRTKTGTSVRVAGADMRRGGTGRRRGGTGRRRCGDSFAREARLLRAKANGLAPHTWAVAVAQPTGKSLKLGWGYECVRGESSPTPLRPASAKRGAA